MSVLSEQQNEQREFSQKDVSGKACVFIINMSSWQTAESGWQEDGVLPLGFQLFYDSLGTHFEEYSLEKGSDNGFLLGQEIVRQALEWEVEFRKIIEVLDILAKPAGLQWDGKEIPGDLEEYEESLGDREKYQIKMIRKMRIVVLDAMGGDEQSAGRTAVGACDGAA